MRFQITDLLKVSVLSAGIFLFVTDLFIINVSLPSMQQSLQLSTSETQWIIILYVIGYASLLISSGNAGNYYGRKKMYLIGMLGFTISSVICGVSEHIYILLFGRLLQGVSSGLMVPQGIALITSLFKQQEKRTLALGIYGSIAGIASVLGQLLGGILPDQSWINESWRLIFLVNIPVGIVALISVYSLIPRIEPDVNAKISYLPMFQLFGLLIGLVCPLILGPELHWPLWSILLLIGSLLLLFIFLKQQKKREQNSLLSLINFSLFDNKIFNLGLAAAFAYYMVQDAYFIINSNYLQLYKNFTPTMTGVAFVYQGIGYVIASIVVSKLVHRNGKSVILYGLTIMISGLIAHLYVYNQPAVVIHQVHVLFFYYGLGCGTVLPSLMTMAIKDIKTDLIGTASGIYLTIQQLSICMGIALVVGIYFHDQNSVFLSMENLNHAYGISSVISIILLVVAGLFITLLPIRKTGTVK
ncbi:MFS transporter [Sphingobacterium kitahiroshimense]|uniref:MFS transporter n=1 Tax=Sphingobacterium kitahiroshimense TaxID=470446 RepID=UPI0032081B4E